MTNEERTKLDEAFEKLKRSTIDTSEKINKLCEESREAARNKKTSEISEAELAQTVLTCERLCLIVDTIEPATYEEVVHDSLGAKEMYEYGALNQREAIKEQLRNVIETLIKNEAMKDE